MRQVVAWSFVLLSAAVFSLAPADAALRSLQPGMEAPDFSLSTVSGENLSLTQLNGGKLTVLVFWSTWSSKSAAALARMEKLYEHYKGRGLTVIGVNADGQDIPPEKLGEIDRFCKQLNLSYPILVDRDLNVFHAYGVIALPTTIILDKDRLIAYELGGYPLIGSEAMADFVTESMEGRKQPPQADAPTRPNTKAVRFFNMGTAAMKTKDGGDSAEQWLRRSVEADPAFILPHLSLGTLYAEQGDSARAEAEFREALARDPANAPALCELAMLLVKEGKGNQGMALFESGRPLYEAYPPCYYYAAYSYGKSGDLNTAMRLFEESEKNNPLDYHIGQYEGRLFEELQDRNRAMAAYRKANERILQLERTP